VIDGSQYEKGYRWRPAVGIEPFSAFLPLVDVFVGGDGTPRVKYLLMSSTAEPVERAFDDRSLSVS
jgi:hypothetical protein